MVSGDTFEQFYQRLIHLAYLTPMQLRYLDALLPLYRMVGRIGLAWVRRESPVIA